MPPRLLMFGRKLSGASQYQWTSTNIAHRAGDEQPIALNGQPPAKSAMYWLSAKKITVKNRGHAPCGPYDKGLFMGVIQTSGVSRRRSEFGPNCDIPGPLDHPVVGRLPAS